MLSNIIILEYKEDGLPYRIRGVGTKNPQPEVNMFNGQRVSKFILCTSGSGVLEVEGKEYNITPGMSFIIKNGIPHKYKPIDNLWGVKVLLFYGKGIDYILEEFNIPKVGIFKFNDNTLLEELHESMYVKAVQISEETEYVLSGKLYEFLVELKLAIQNIKPSQKNFPQLQVERIKAYIEENYNKELSIEEIAAYMDISKQYLCRIFKETMGQRPFEYLNYIRIKRAKEMLIKDLDLPIDKIVKLVGFNSPSYFGLIFKKYEKISPGQYRIMNR